MWTLTQKPSISFGGWATSNELNTVADGDRPSVRHVAGFRKSVTFAMNEKRPRRFQISSHPAGRDGNGVGPQERVPRASGGYNPLAISVAALFVLLGLPPVGWAQDKVSVIGFVENERGLLIPDVKVTLLSGRPGDSHETVSDILGRFSFPKITPGPHLLGARARGYEPAQVAVTVGTEPVVSLKVTVRRSGTADIPSTGTPAPKVSTQSVAGTSSLTNQALAPPPGSDRALVLPPDSTDERSGNASVAAIVGKPISLRVQTASATADRSGQTLRGTILDETKGPIGEARITLIATTTGERYETTSDIGGAFTFAGVVPGEYVLNVEAQLFRPVEMPVAVGTEPIRPIRIRMTVALDEQVVVEGVRGQATISPEANASSVFVDNDLLAGLPAQNLDMLSLISNFVDPAVAGMGGLSVLVDGLETRASSLPSSSIRRVYLNKNPYGAEYRRPGKGRVEVLTEDGSLREFHGGGALFVRDGRLDAPNAFAPVKSNSARQAFDVSLGGPLSNRLASFFLSAEHRRHDETVVVNAQTLAGPIVQNVHTPEHETRLLARFDRRPNRLTALTARYDFADESSSNQGVGGFSLADQGFDTTARHHRFHFSMRGSFRTNITNELRFIVERESERAGRNSEGPAIVVSGAFRGGNPQTFQTHQETTAELQYVATYFVGLHNLRLGLAGRPSFIESSDASNFRGTFEFATLDEFALGMPFVYRVNQGDPHIAFRMYDAYGFFQDEMKPRPDLSVTVGVRYDWQSDLDDLNNVAPRVTVAYAPGDQRTVLRGGAGIFYDRLPTTVTERTMRFDGVRVQELVVARPALTNPLGTGDASIRIPSVTQIAPDIQAPYLIQSSVGVERIFGRRTQATIEYQHSRGSFLFRSRNINLPRPGTQDRPDPRFRHVNQIESTATMRSNALNMTFRSVVRRRFRAIAQYTLSKATDDTRGVFGLPADNFDLRAEKGRADYDRRHRFNLGATVDLPFGLRIGSVVNLASGYPVDITTGFDDNRDTVANDRPAGLTRNTGQGPGFAQLDVRFTKYFTLPRDESELHFNIDAFNVLNRTNFANFVGVQSSPFFGRANSAREPRTIQLSMKYNF